jgi:hypothetical protein
MDSQFPTIQLQKNKAEFHPSVIDGQMNYPVLPRGMMSSEDDVSFKEPKNSTVPPVAIYSESDMEDLKAA